MDRLFTYETLKMLEKLEMIEPEMCEDSYKNENYSMESFVLEIQSENAKAYIKEIFCYMKQNWVEGECTVLGMMKELYRIAVTGEYSYLQAYDEISYKSDVFERLFKESGYKEVIYACRLLRYYYLVNEKNHHPRKVWKEMEQLNKKVCELGPVKKIDKKAKQPDSSKELTEMEFMLAFKSHMDKHYIGQDLLKKKMCSVLDQWKYHDVRTTLLMIGPSGSGKNYMIETIRSFPELKMPVVSFDCSSLTPNGFVGGDVNEIFKKIKSVTGKRRASALMTSSEPTEKCIVFLDEIDKVINFHHDSHGESVNAMVQQQLLSSLAGTETIEGVDTSKVLFILGGAFPRINDLKKEKGRNPLGFNASKKSTVDVKESVREQIIAIGGETEFVGRIEDIVVLSKPTREDLKAILMDENIGVFTKKKKLYMDSGLDLDIEEDTVEAIVDLIVKEDAGARSVKNIMNQFADNQYFYDMKIGGFSGMKIHKGMLYGEAPIFVKGGDSSEKRTKLA